MYRPNSSAPHTDWPATAKQWDVVALSGATSQASVAAPGPASLQPEGSWVALLGTLSGCPTGRLLYVAVLKRVLDIVLASLLLILAAPVLLVIALLIRLDSPGPALFRQQRIGRGGTPFTIYKFRTMRHDPHRGLELLRDENGQLRHKVRHDPRITRAGRLLRKTSIDELPQLLNVIRGEMSLVGPRPELPQIVAAYAPWQHQRHLLRPGMTGWWQVAGRSDRPMHENTELDLFYVERVSCRLDLQILLKTIRVVMRGLGAF